MTIKDIAEIANVSPTTVSQIINNKDKNISKETRERVLAVIDECGYLPYEKIRSQIMSRSKTIGLIVPQLTTSFYSSFSCALQKRAESEGYSLMLSVASGSTENEKSVMDSFVTNQTSGIILFSGTDKGRELLGGLSTKGISCLCIDNTHKTAYVPQIICDTENIAKACTAELLKHNFVRIGLCLDKDSSQDVSQAAIHGYSSCLEEYNIDVEQNHIIQNDSDFSYRFRRMIDAGVNAVVCQNFEVSSEVYALASRDAISIPSDLSVISMEDSIQSEKLYPPLSAYTTDIEELSNSAFNSLLAQVKGKPLPFSSSIAKSHYAERGSISRNSSVSSKILVLGYLNMDTVLSMDNMPSVGETLVSNRLGNFPGGKGGNQAFGISRMNGNATLIGKLGADIHGRTIFDHLSRNGVNMKGVSFDPELLTGKAYINLFPDGKSSVVIDPGVNTSINPDYILSKEDLFTDAKYCLCQTDISLESVLTVQTICNRKKIPLILRLAYYDIPCEVLNGLYLISLNASFGRTLFPKFTDNEIVQYYLDNGVKNVILHESVSGCIWGSEFGVKNYPSFAYPCVDSTGVSDAFLSCLAVLLCEGYDLDTSIKAANWTAAYNSSHLGIQNSMPTRQLIDEIINDRVKIEFRA